MRGNPYEIQRQIEEGYRDLRAGAVFLVSRSCECGTRDLMNRPKQGDEAKPPQRNCALGE